MSWLLLVEGQDDVHVVRNLLFSRGIDVREQLHESRGDTPLLELLRAAVIGSTHRVVAAIIDCDLNVAARWQSIRDVLAGLGYAVPQQPHAEGTIIDGERIVGIWLMPDNTKPGKLEDFVELLIPPHDTLWPEARAAVASIPDQSRRFSATATIKAEIHTWLAWQEEPGTRMGAAITKRYLQTDGHTADTFVAWIQKLAAAAQD